VRAQPEHRRVRRRRERRLVGFELERRRRQRRRLLERIVGIVRRIVGIVGLLVIGFDVRVSRRGDVALRPDLRNALRSPI
jgi:hypothetical protein